MTVGRFDDIHTHCPDAGSNAVINLDRGMAMRPDGHYSVGVHPWDSADADVEEQWAEVETLASDQRVVMIGECGLDKKRGASMETQLELLKRHIRLSEDLGKPLLLHIVGAYPEVIKLRRDNHQAQPWIIHGFRGKPQLAAELLRHGFSLSFGEYFNPETVRAVPADRLYTETDTSVAPIAQIRQAVAIARHQQ